MSSYTPQPPPSYLEGPTKQDRPWAYRQKFTVLICQMAYIKHFHLICETSVKNIRMKVSFIIRISAASQMRSVVFPIENSMKFHDTKYYFRKRALKKIQSPAQHFIFISFNVMKFLEILFVKYTYIDR